MKKLLVVSLIFLSGCCLNKDYVAADRATWEAMRPVIEMGIRAQALHEQPAYQLLDDSWKIRWQKGEEYVGSND